MRTGQTRGALIKALAVMFLAAGLTGCIQESQPTGGKAQKGTPPEAGNGEKGASSIAEGEALFRQMCVSCHGTAGNGMGSRNGPSLQRPEFTHGSSRDAIKQSIRDGRPGGMPSFGHVFTAGQLDAVVRYVQSLRK